MANISADGPGRRRIQFTDAGGKRFTIRLGNMEEKPAQVFLYHVERLQNAQATGDTIPRDTSAWLAQLGDKMHERIAKTGLVAGRAAPQLRTLRGLLDAYFDVLDVKDSTETRYRQTERLLVEHFGEETPLAKITLQAAEGWRAALVDHEYAPAKVAKEVSIARQIFRKGSQWGLIDSNPFEGVKAGSQHNRERLLDATSSTDWKAIIALARWGGLRTPSETLRVRWVDVDWGRGRLRVRSPKTEAHAGKGDRVIPLFPELRQVLQEAFEKAEDGAVYVVGAYRDASATNLRTQLLRLIERAGLVAWPRLFNAMRASRATELAAEYPVAVCTAWMGHTAAVAEAHYHMVRESDFERAASERTRESRSKSDVQHPDAASRKPSQNTRQRAKMRGGATPCEAVVGPEGLEPSIPFRGSGF